MTLQQVRRQQSLFRWRSHLNTAREYLYSLREVRLLGQSDMPVTDGCGPTYELHYRSLIHSARTMAHQSRNMANYPGWSL